MNTVTAELTYLLEALRCHQPLNLELLSRPFCGILSGYITTQTKNYSIFDWWEWAMLRMAGYSSLSV